MQTHYRVTECLLGEEVVGRHDTDFLQKVVYYVLSKKYFIFLDFKKAIRVERYQNWEFPCDFAEREQNRNATSCSSNKQKHQNTHTHTHIKVAKRWMLNFGTVFKIQLMLSVVCGWLGQMSRKITIRLLLCHSHNSALYKRWPPAVSQKDITYNDQSAFHHSQECPRIAAMYHALADLLCYSHHIATG